jgi:uncharacterized protein (TIGR02118 family)
MQIPLSGFKRLIAAPRLRRSALSCTIDSSPQYRGHGESNMIKVSVMYPNNPGSRFNHEYYRDKHMPMVKARMGDKLKSYAVDKGIAGGTPGSAPAYAAAGHLLCESVEAFQAGFGPHAKEILGDIPNYTDISPLMQISEVIVG